MPPTLHTLVTSDPLLIAISGWGFASKCGASCCQAGLLMRHLRSCWSFVDVHLSTTLCRSFDLALMLWTHS